MNLENIIKKNYLQLKCEQLIFGEVSVLCRWFTVMISLYSNITQNLVNTSNGTNHCHQMSSLIICYITLLLYLFLFPAVSYEFISCISYPHCCFFCWVFNTLQAKLLCYMEQHVEFIFILCIYETFNIFIFK